MYFTRVSTQKWCFMLKIKGFKKTYKEAVITVDGVDTQARVVLLVGENGSGKSTILKAMAGLIRFDGEIEFKGSFMYAEELINYPEYLTARQYLTLLRRLGNASKIRLQWLIDAFMLKTHLDKPFKALSKGMKQKIHLIQAMMEIRDFYLLDEPLSGLDETAQQQLVKLIAKSDEAFVIATHQTDVFDVLGAKKVAL